MARYTVDTTAPQEAAVEAMVLRGDYPSGQALVQDMLSRRLDGLAAQYRGDATSRVTDLAAQVDVDTLAAMAALADAAIAAKQRGR